MKFRKKPIVIEAEQFLQGDEATAQFPSGVIFGVLPGSQFTVPYVQTLEGPLKVSHGDWIITGVKGEKYPCKPDIFEATYEALPDAQKQETK